MTQLALFLFLIVFFFYMKPTVMRQLAAMQEGGYLYEKFITFMKTERKTELLYFMVGCMAVNILLQRRLMLWVFLTLHAAVLLFLPIISRKKRIKQAPAWDARLVRIALVALLLMLLVVFVLAAVFKTTFLWEVPFIMSFLGFMTDTWILLANWITSPFEKIAGKKAAKAALSEIQEENEERAKRGEKPIAILGVAGTYGKTAFTQILKHILCGSLRVSVPDPAGAGTLAEAAEVLRTACREKADLAIVEILCRRVGDIRAFRDCVPLTLGVLISGTDRYMETFLSRDRLASTLAEMEPGEGECAYRLLINYDDELLRKRGADKRFIRYGSWRGHELPQHLDVWAEDISVGLEGASFVLRDRDGLCLQISVPLTGRFTVLAAVAASTLALRLGVQAEELPIRFSNLSPWEGCPSFLPEGAWPDRLKRALAKPWEKEGEETKRPAPFRILDDPGESSVEGARDTLSIFGDCKGYRVLVTRGLRGQGEREDEANRILGRAAARGVDSVIVIGKEKFSFIEDGAQRGGLSADDVHLAVDFRDALRRLYAISEDVDGKCFALFLGRIGK